MKTSSTSNLFAKFLLPVFLITSLFLAHDSSATEKKKGRLILPVTQQGDHSIKVPKNGMTKEEVIAKFGPPQNRKAPVGDPPITRWEYSGFYVYFEYNLVLHSVIKK